MKKNFMYAMMSAIALAGTVGFTSCAGNEEVAEVNPGYNPETGEVPVNFVFNVQMGSTPATRMSGANVQVGTTDAFRGMDETALMSFKLPANGKNVASSATAADKLYALGPILAASAIGPDTEEKSHRVLELALPTETNTLMFWGKATKSTGTGQDMAQGKITYSTDMDFSKNSFKLCPIVPDGETKTAFQQYQTLLAAILNNIISSGIEDETVTFTKDGVTETAEHVTMNWSDFALVDKSGEDDVLVINPKSPLHSDGSKSMSALGEILSKAYVSFNTIKDSELRAGSAPAIERMLVDLYTVIQKVSGASPTTIEEAVTQQVGVAIASNLSNFMNDTHSGWGALSTIKAKAGLSSTAIDKVTDLANYPGNFNMPDGATVLTSTFTAGGKAVPTQEGEYPKKIANYTYSYRATIPTYNMSGEPNSEPFDIFNYMYPAELCYFGNSPIRVSNGTFASTGTTNTFPDGATNWNTDSKWVADTDGNGWTKNGKIVSSTRSVAMQNNIKYGTALLKTSVKYGAAKLEDNNKGLHSSEDPNEIDVTANLFTLKGVLIGGQEQEMGWDYVAKAASPTFKMMIYDNAIPDGSKAIPAYAEEGAYSAPNYTLVWDNWNKLYKGSKQNVVYVALEFVNNGKDFWGQNNLIRSGGTFYITAMLDPDAGKNATSTTDRSLGVEWPTDAAPYALPPYYTAADETENNEHKEGSTIKERRVFIQDYVTEATFVISANSLKKALVAVPDLRSAQISLGLSVDLKWSTGMQFENVELGGH